MAKKPNIKKPKKPAKKLTSQGVKREVKPKRMVQVTLPALIPGRGVYEPEPPPSIYEIEYKDAMLAVQMEQLAAKGLTNDAIIDALPISRDTFYKRLKEDPYFSYCLNKHRGKAVAMVESALFQNSVGFEFTEQQATASGKVVTVKKMKLPETKAQEFFLINRAADQWKKKVETTIQAGESMGAMIFAIKRREE